MVVERATGRSHAQLLRERILEPLGMADTYYQGHDKLPEGKIAQGYFDIYNNNTITNLSNYNTGAGNGMGGMISTAIDLQLFIKALFVQKTLITEQSLEQMMQFSPTDSPSRFLGVGIVKDLLSLTTYGHTGGDLGYTSSLYWIPERNASLALLINYGSTQNSSLAPLIWELKFALLNKIAE
jgi:D-alanyl-D-alanine carboxypeptidase